MNREISKLLRRVAKTDPFEFGEMSHDGGYIASPNRHSLLTPPGEKMAYKQLKKMYKSGQITIEDLREILDA